jgi:hypothetical protein
MRSPTDVSGPSVARRLACMGTEHIGAGEGAEGALELDLSIEPREGLSGTVAPRGDQARVTRFSGWLGLAEAIDVMRREAGHPQASPKSGPAESERPA